MTIIGITMGCPVGIGPEIILRYFADKDRPTGVWPVVLGDIDVLDKCRSQLQLQGLCVPWLPGTPLPDGGIPVVQLSFLKAEELVWGQANKVTGRAMAQYIMAGVKYTQQNLIHGITTCPISKTSLNLAGYDFPGHTEMLASLTRTKNFAMMMVGNKLRITLVTIHRPLKEVPISLTRDSVYSMIRTTHQALVSDFAVVKPRIGVASLNPHGGESGIFGDEEENIIAPAIGHAKADNMDVLGPYPPDTIFVKAASDAFDAVVCMYHDQGLIPFKLLHFDDGVNVTLGLPIVRTSVDHGTAYDIAGKGLASHKSLSEAVKLAASINQNRAV